MEIGITSWDKHNPRRDQKTYTWLKLSNDIGTDPDMFGFDAEEKFLWILLLCECSKKSSSEITININWLTHNSGIKTEKVQSGIQKLFEGGFVYFPKDLKEARPDTDAIASEYDRALAQTESSTTPILDKNRIDKNREEESRAEGEKSAAAISSDQVIDEQIPSDVYAFLTSTLMFPDDIVEEVRREARLQFIASIDPNKNWKRFVGAYFKNEKHKIEDRLRDRAKNLPKPKLDHADCVLCSNSGRSIMIEKKSACEYAFQCTCTRGPEQIGLPKQFEGMSETYTHFKSWSLGNFDRTSTVKNHRATVAV